MECMFLGVMGAVFAGALSWAVYSIGKLIFEEGVDKGRRESSATRGGNKTAPHAGYQPRDAKPTKPPGPSRRPNPPGSE